MRFFGALAALAVLLAGCGQGYKNITAAEARKIMEEESEYMIVDVRTEEEYEEKHIPGAVLVPSEDIKAGELDALPDKEETLLVYCYAGRRAEDCASILAKNGYKHVYNFGGILDWDGETVTGEAG